MVSLSVSYFNRKMLLLACVVLLCGISGQAQDNSGSHSSAPNDEDQPSAKAEKSSDQTTTKLHIHVTGTTGKAVANASVYVRYNKPGGLLHKDKLAELDLKTNEEGSVKVPPVPQGNILVQVIAPGWHTFGKWYEINKDEDSIEIKLEPPTKWY